MRLDRQISYLVKVQRTTLGFTEQPRRVSIGTSERTFFVSEEDGSGKFPGNGGTVHFDKGFVSSGTLIVQDMGNMFLASTAFTAYHHRKVIVRNALRPLYKFLIDPADSSDDFRVTVIPASPVQDFPDGLYKWNIIHRFFDKLYCAPFYGIYRSRHIAVLGHDDKGNRLSVLVDPVENLDAASIR